MSETKQVIVMRTDLGMRKGKMIAQGSHASMAFITKNMNVLRIKGGHLGFPLLTDEQVEWLASSFVKICVKATSEEELLSLHEAALNAGLVSHLITDAGRTEFGGVPTNTCIAIGPHRAEKIDPITGHLDLL